MENKTSNVKFWLIGLVVVIVFGLFVAASINSASDRLDTEARGAPGTQPKGME